MVILINVVLMLVSIPVMINKTGVTGAAWAVVFSKLAAIPVSLYLARRIINFDFLEFLRKIIPSLISCTVLGSFLFWIP